MSSKTKRQLQAELTKDRLFAAAVELLGERDFEEIKIRDIVTRAQVSIGTFYNYYSTKMEVFYETYRVADEYFSDVVAPLLTHARIYDRILCFFEHYARYSSELTDIKMTRLLYNSSNPFFNRDKGHGMLSVLIEQLQLGLDSGEFSAGDTAGEMADYLMISVRGLVYNWCTKSGAYSLKDAIQQFVTRLMCAYLR